MKTVWLIECTAHSPSVYIGAEGGLTYRPHKAKQFDSRVAAELEMLKLRLATSWEAVSKHVSDNDAA
jgi:hypothetical protein